MLRRLARALVLKYPSAWRARYEDEVLALIDDSPVRFSDLGELARGLIVERAKALIEPGNSPRLSAFGFSFIALLVRITPTVLLIVGAAVLAEVARGQIGIPSENVSLAGILVLSAVGAGFLWRKWTTRSERGVLDPVYPFFPAWARVVMLSALFVGTFLLQLGAQSVPPGAESLYAVNRWLRLWIWIVVADALTSGFWPWRPMLDAFHEYRSATYELRWAQMEVDRCRKLVEAGDAEPQALSNAEIARDRITDRRNEASVVLHSYGYRARFQS